MYACASYRSYITQPNHRKVPPMFPHSKYQEISNFPKNKKQEKALQKKIEERLAGKRGEFVLLSFDAEIRFKYTWIGDEYRHASCYRIGVLEGEKLMWNGEDQLSAPTLPISRYLKGEEGIFRPGDNIGGVVQKNIFAHGYCDEDPPPLHALMQNECGSIVIGDEAVKEWLQKRGMEELFKLAATALSKLILEPTDDTD